MAGSLSALDFFAAKLAFEVTPDALSTALTGPTPPTVVDTRPLSAWRRGRVPGALHIPYERLGSFDPDLLPDEDADIVVYSWGRDDLGGARAAVALLRQGYMQVRELVGGFDAWEDAGFEVVAEPGQVRHLPTPVSVTRPVRPQHSAGASSLTAARPLSVRG
ncbi:MAG TPA: rhodanese-like domain-containing protein [Propionibacteriaceae bacterium]|nr:rhodanese-like domain-containing protein [Propionibacteriaceae bacterium]